jgi:hypothetical protein
MTKFLELCEEFDPSNNENPKWKLIDCLKEKGIPVSMVRDTDMVYIDTGNGVVAVTVSNTEEEAESVNVGFGDYSVEKEVEGLANKASSGLKGMAGKMIGTSAQKAKSAVKKRQNVAKKAVGAYDQATNRLDRTISKMQKPVSTLTY